MKRGGESADVDLRRAEKREGVIRARLAKIGGITGSTMRAVSRFFCRYAETPRPDLFPFVLDKIQHLQIMALPEHRNGVGGAIAAVVSLHPEHQDAWRKAHTRLIESAERLSPPYIDEEVSRAGQTEYIWMLWLVTRDQSALQRIIRLAHRHDSVGEAALSLLHVHAMMPEVASVLVETLTARQARAMPHFQVPATDVPIEDIRSLKDAIVTPTTQQVVLVGWLMGNPDAPEPKPKKARRKKSLSSLVTEAGNIARTGGFLIITVDGSTPPGCPLSWKGKPVVVRKARPEELRAHKAMHDAAEAP